MSHDMTLMKFAAESLFKLADAIEAEDVASALEAPETVAVDEEAGDADGSEVAVFKCDGCEHSAPLADINVANTEAGSTEPVTAEDRVRCPQCGGIMSVEVSAPEVDADLDDEGEDEDESEDTGDYLMKEATAMNLSPSQRSIIEGVKQKLSPVEESWVNKILSGQTPILNDLLEQAEKTDALRHLEDVTHFGFDGVNGAHKNAGAVVYSSVPNVSKVISALLIAASLAMANGHAPAGSVFSILNDYAKAHPEAQRVMQENIKKVEALGAKGQQVQEHAIQTMKEKQEASKAQALQDSEAPSARAEAPTAPTGPNPDDVWRTASMAVRNASLNSEMLGKYMV